MDGIRVESFRVSHAVADIMVAVGAWHCGWHGYEVRDGSLVAHDFLSVYCTWYR